MIQSIMSRGQGIVSSGEPTSTLEAGFLALAMQTWMAQYPHSNISAQAGDYLDRVLQNALPRCANASACTQLPLDRLTVGQALWRKKPDITAAEASSLAVLNQSLAVQPRNADGGFWYYTYANWSYLDGTVSFLPFMSLLSPGWSASDATLQLRLLNQHCRDPSGLLVHGYDDSRTAVWADGETGGSPFVWGRSLGWYLTGLLQGWEVLTTPPEPPEDAAGPVSELRLEIYAQMIALSAALLPFADPTTGAWWQLPTLPGRTGNFLESSSTALFVAALLKAARVGLADAGVIPVARRAYEYMLDGFVVHEGDGSLGFNGTVAVCSLNSTASYEYYTTRPILLNGLLGEAAFVMASLEMERLELEYL